MAMDIASITNWHHLGHCFPDFRLSKDNLIATYGKKSDFELVEHMLDRLAELLLPVTALKAALESLHMHAVVKKYIEHLTDVPQLAAAGEPDPAPCVVEDIDYIHLMARGPLKKLTIQLLDQIQWLWNALSKRDFAFVNVGGNSIEESIANAMNNLPFGSSHSNIEGTIIDAFTNFALEQLIEVELYYIHNAEGTASLGCKTVGKANGLIYRFCILPTGQCTLVVGGHAREYQLWKKRHDRLSQVHSLVTSMNGTDALSKQFVKDYHALYKQRMEVELAPTKRPIVAVVGNPGVGKSTLVNQLLGGKVLPARNSVESVTAFPCILSYADINGCEVIVDYLQKEDILSLLKVDRRSAAEPTDKSRTNLIQHLTFATDLEVHNKLELIENSLKTGKFDGLSTELAEILEKIIKNQATSLPFANSAQVQKWLNSLSPQHNALIQKITIRTRSDTLKSADLVDLPGLNDVLNHRSKRTTDFIDQCDFLFFVTKARLNTLERQVYSKLVSLQKPMAVVYTHFFSLDDMDDLVQTDSAKMVDDVEQYQTAENASLFLVAKHFQVANWIRQKVFVVPEGETSDSHQLSQATTTRIPIITLDSGWRNTNAEACGETISVPPFLSNVNTVKLYFQSISNKYIKEHSDRMAQLMQEWLQSIKTARKEPILSEAFLNTVLTKHIHVKHNFTLELVSKKAVNSVFQPSTDENIQHAQLSVISMFKTSNDQYVRGVAWRSIVDDAYDNVDGWFGLNSAYARFTANLFRDGLLPDLTKAASALAHALDEYVSEAIRKFNTEIMEKLNQSEEKIHMEAKLSQGSAVKISNISINAQKYLAKVNNFLVRVVSRVAASKYLDALEDCGTGVVKRVSAELSNATFVKSVIQSLIDGVGNEFVPEFYTTLKDAAEVILRDVMDDTRRTFFPLTIGTPVTLKDIFAQANFREIIELLYDIDSDAQSLN